MAVRQRITIVGTGCIGTSIGLALRQSADAGHLEIVGHDRDFALARQAQELGAFDRTILNLDLALRDAKLVILAVPLAALRETMQDVGRLLEPNRDIVVTDTAPLKAPATEWARIALPSAAHYVGGDPFLAPGTGGWEPLHGLDHARADLFREAVYAVVPTASDHPSAVRTVANLALVLGATPLFMAPTEHDAVRLLSSEVPSLIATALFTSTAEAPGWQEVRRAAGREFATATAAASGDVASHRMAMLLGRETVVRGLDTVIAQLHELRELLALGDSDALESALTKAAVKRAHWLLESQSRSWEASSQIIERESLFERTIRTLFGRIASGKSGH